MFLSHSPEQTFAFGEALGQLLVPGTLVCLEGQLGAGKTKFTQGLLKGLGVEEPVVSPTYTIVHEYEGRYPVYHFDVYRLNHWTELEDLGYEEYFYGQGVTVVEWADLVKEALPSQHIWIQLLPLEVGEEEQRKIQVQVQGNLYQSLVKEWKQQCTF